MYIKFKHLKFHVLLEIMKHGAWWQMLDQDLKSHLLYCLKCLTAQKQLFWFWTLNFLIMNNSSLQIFEQYGINLIDLLSTTSNRTWWIFIAINYITSCFFAQVVKDREAKTIANFIMQEIFIYYWPLKELLSYNNTKL